MPFVEFAYNNCYHSSIGMAQFEALYCRCCRTPLFWDEVVERQVQRPELVQQEIDQVELIKKITKTAQGRQSSYTDTKRKPLQFQSGEKVFLKVSPFCRVMRFGFMEKLARRFIGPFGILECVGNLAYRLALPPYLSSIHNVIHASLLRRYVVDEWHVRCPIDVQLIEDLTYVKQSLLILGMKEKKIRNKTIPLVLEQWPRRGTAEATWELENELYFIQLYCTSTLISRRKSL
ncbi:uncharacterized protein [Primulina huaijiensis]|uniref:uncharacterized protein n=1 Tax=Primulina huaijiensis TaxID=1492673 RepID=UPI003CC722EE